MLREKVTERKSGIRKYAGEFSEPQSYLRWKATICLSSRHRLLSIIEATEVEKDCCGYFVSKSANRKNMYVRKGNEKIPSAKSRTCSKSSATATHRVTDAGSFAKEHLETADAVGKNDPCPCGSGKKYKACCGKKVKRAMNVRSRKGNTLGILLSSESLTQQ